MPRPNTAQELWIANVLLPEMMQIVHSGENRHQVRVHGGHQPLPPSSFAVDRCLRGSCNKNALSQPLCL